jgi:site-specific DNA recombinase
MVVCMPTRAIAYLRVSTDEQATSGVSLDAQRAKVLAYASLYEIDVISVEVDAGVSAKSLKRPALQRALASLQRGEADALLVVKLDRLTRSVRDLADLLDLFSDGKRSLLSVGEQIDTRSAAGRLVLNLLTSVASWEREAIGERTSTALQHKRTLGQSTGQPPFGWSVGSDGSTLVEHAGEQAVVAEIRALRDAGCSLRDIVATLAERGRVGRAGKPLAITSVRNVLVRVAA